MIGRAIVNSCFIVYSPNSLSLSLSIHQVKGAIDFVDVSTPLSIAHYLASPGGAAVGLDPAPERYGGDWKIMSQLDSISPVRGLALTGQDTLICGVIMAQVSGLATAIRLLGPIAGAKFVARTLLHAE